MRQIKFRYVYRNIDTDEIKTVIKDITQIEKDSEPYMDKWVLISRDEFSSLYDKNGNEIYERDILLKDFRYYTVEFYNGSFWLSNNNRRRICRMSDNESDSEIIGSIHDNPELLNEKQ
ncbi:hypothetical protein E2605_07690 [Dysgonomonas capnocytophagoides]|uniref:YopX protein domain-containing protein n=1 Tax=Dysgonomonas capnocytophagoides TaxID=45254 RepID=A0A4Y8L2B7_9BACT|nr:YopX family protein [Dysgonomonas capnocytophagoides]TFD96693.1 hypothetical protein E2605_07690 [Dysgonomonas capnocytophagoides]